MYCSSSDYVFDYFVMHALSHVANFPVVKIFRFERKIIFEIQVQRQDQLVCPLCGGFEMR
jgi:hypothetical protein